MKKTPFIRIGTRKSKLALWQAETVQQMLGQHGVHGIIVPVSSTGDENQGMPIYQIGITGVFTKELDAALLNNEIDIAVHSHKDVPTTLAEGLEIFAIPFRHQVEDVLIPSESGKITTHPELPCTIATGSLRRQAQWLNKYPHHHITDLRGNVQTRLIKLQDNNWDGAIFAKAGLERMNLLPENAVILDWMLSAPGQGAVMIVGKSTDVLWKEKISGINDTIADICTGIEKDFLMHLEGGCTAPIGALAIIEKDEIVFKGNLLSKDGRKKAEISHRENIAHVKGLAKRMAMKIRTSGGEAILDELKETYE